jgi:hypothetical protein
MRLVPVRRFALALTKLHESCAHDHGRGKQQSSDPIWLSWSHLRFTGVRAHLSYSNAHVFSMIRQAGGRIPRSRIRMTEQKEGAHVAQE